MLAVIGFVLLRSSSIKSLGVNYFAIFLVATGAFPGGPGFLSWALNSLSFPLFLSSMTLKFPSLDAAGPAVRALIAAYVVSVGTLGAVIATWTYLEKDKKAGYATGHAINLGAQICVVVLAVAEIVYCKYENKVREAGGRNHRLEGLNESDVVELGY